VAPSLCGRAVVQKILAHLDNTANSAATTLLPDCRASPTVGLLVWKDKLRPAVSNR